MKPLAVAAIHGDQIKADRASEQLRASFAEHLLRNQLTDERHGRFMIHWVRRYLVHPPPVSNATPSELMDAFLGQLRKEDLKVWQLDQARQRGVSPRSPRAAAPRGNSGVTLSADAPGNARPAVLIMEVWSACVRWALQEKTMPLTSLPLLRY